jgi:hypothetical protein
VVNVPNSGMRSFFKKEKRWDEVFFGKEHARCLNLNLGHLGGSTDMDLNLGHLGGRTDVEVKITTQTSGARTCTSSIVG